METRRYDSRGVGHWQRNVFPAQHQDDRSEDDSATRRMQRHVILSSFQKEV